MNCLLVNYPEPACGVAQFGRNLWAILKDSSSVRWSYADPQTVGELRSVTSMPEPDVILYNWQGGQHGFLVDAPFPWLSAKQFLVYHDLDINESKWDGILFSDPTLTPRKNWHSIGRPLPQFSKRPNTAAGGHFPIIGCNGFIGAFADQVVHKVVQEFEYAKIRLSLPFAKYGDANGSQALAMAERCRSMVVNNPGIKLEISHEFMPLEQLLHWLNQNDINCYIRPPAPWRGVSSAPDAAIACGKPLAVNRCQAFRHLHNLSPSICVEDSSLLEIMANGVSPLAKLYADWSPENIRKQVEDAICKT